MPPKAKAAAPSKKTEQKKKEKVIEDKTFGLKNKKGAKQQRFIQQVEKQVKFGGNPSSRKLEDTKKQERDKKDAKLKEAKELNMLFKPVATQKVEKGTDPKSVLCAFYKQGQCAKGDKCKFSHDLTLERKAEKRSMYHDMRDSEETMEDWDEEKLKEVVEKKDAEYDKRPTTDIICKHFIDAVEKSKYGWFWECPSGSKCIYRHALPPGFVLKKDKKKDEKKDEISLEDLIERERSSLGSNLTKVTLETFIAWKKRKIMEKEESARKDEEKKRTEYKAGRQIGVLTAIRFFATGSYQRCVGQDFHISMGQASVSNCIRKVSQAINEILAPASFTFPRTFEERQVIKNRFMEARGFPGVIGCIDCTHVRVIKPSVREEAYYNHHYRSHSINVQALSGREMFTFNPEMASADQYEEGDDAFDTGNLPDDNDNEENIEYREIVLDSIVSEAQEADGSGTKAAEDRLKLNAAEHAASNGIGGSDSMQNGVKSDSGTDSGASVSGGHRNAKGDSDEDSNGDSDEGSDSGENEAGAVGVPIDENLFLDEDLGDGLDEFELNL